MGKDLILLASVSIIKINLNQIFFVPSIKLVLQTFVLFLIPEGITHLIKHRRLQSNCIIHLIVFSIHLQSFSIQFLIVSVVTVSIMQPLVWLSRYILHPQKFNHVLNVSTLCFETDILLLQQNIKPSIQIPLCDQIDHHIIIPIYENVHFKHFLYMMGFNLYPCVFNHHPQFSLLLTAFDTC